MSWGCRKNWDEKTPKGSKEGKSVADPPPPPAQYPSCSQSDFQKNQTQINQSVNTLTVIEVENVKSKLKNNLCVCLDDVFKLN